MSTILLALHENKTCNCYVIWKAIMAETAIEWTDATWNPVAGCTNCYAMQMARRLEAMGMEKYKGLTRKSGNRTVWTGTVVEDLSSLTTPLKWKKSRKIFVNSMSDLFHPDVSVSFVKAVWDIMEQTPRHNYQILTKRPERMAKYPWHYSFEATAKRLDWH